MKKTLLIVGIMLIIMGVFGLLLGLLFWYVRMHTLDGSAGLYAKQNRLMIVFLLTGAIVLAAGIMCLVLKGKVVS